MIVAGEALTSSSAISKSGYLFFSHKQAVLQSNNSEIIECSKVEGYFVNITIYYCLLPSINIYPITVYYRLYYSLLPSITD